MHSTWVLAASLVATVACRPTGPSPTSTPTEPAAATAEPTASAPAPKLEGDAVVRVGAKLYLAATGDEGFAVPALGPAPGLAVHIVDEPAQGRVVVETVTAGEHHCAAVLGELADVRLRLYVSAVDLVPLLTDDVEHAFEDGTKVLLSRGVPTAVAGEFVARGTVVRAPVPASRLGLAFSPGEPRALDGGGALATLRAHPLMVGGRALAEENLHGESRGSLMRYGATERGDTALVTVRNACLEVTASVAIARLQAPVRPKSGLYEMKGPKDPIPQMGDGPDGILGTDGVYRRDDGPRVVEPMVSKHYDVKVDTPIWSVDGRAAGKVVAPHRFGPKPYPKGDRTCFDLPIDRAQIETVAVCFDPTDLVEAPRSGYGSSGSTGATVRQAKADVKGALDPDLVRRIVRAHINEVRHCYGLGLAKLPTLKGRVAVAFTIDAKGTVTTADVAETSLADADVGTCIAAAVKRWKFPKPGDAGTVQVTYPFVLEPG